MTVLGIAAFLMAITLGWLLARDFRRRETGLFVFSADRKSNHLRYWSFMGIWLIAMLFCILLTIGSLIAVNQCTGTAPCKITITVAAPEK